MGACFARYYHRLDNTKTDPIVEITNTIRQYNEIKDTLQAPYLLMTPAISNSMISHDIDSTNDKNKLVALVAELKALNKSYAIYHGYTYYEIDHILRDDSHLIRVCSSPAIPFYRQIAGTSPFVHPERHQRSADIR
jgi:hypothetical protein